MAGEIISINLLSNETLDLDYINWDQQCELKNQEISLETQFFFLSNGSNLCQDVDKLLLDTRIGSESSNAQVFRYIPVPDSDERNVFAIKIVPYEKKSEANQIVKEIDIGKELSSADDTPWTMYPKIYASGKCGEVSVKKDSNLYRKYRKETLKAYYIVYELLSYDLIQLIDSNIDVSSSKVIKIISNIFDAIDDLNNTRMIKHNDLHCGNVMFRCDSKGLNLKPVLIDFGMSNDYTESDVFVDKYGDIVALFNSLSSRLDKPLFKDKSNIKFAIQVINDMLLEADYIEMDKYINTVSNFKKFFITLAQEGNFTDKYSKLEQKFVSLK